MAVPSIAHIPELQTGTDGGLIRIPPETDVPLTRRVRHLIDSEAFQRLAKISQLGLVSLVYPAAHHSRFEHSLGVFRMALRYLQQLAGDARFSSVVTPQGAERFLVAALLHDVGHWPFCHPIEDMRIEGMPRHEECASSFIEQGEIAELLEQEWDVEPARVMALLRGQPQDVEEAVLCSLLSGPIDVDKMDYLSRDSLHAGVPYGQNFDQARLVASLCLNETGDSVAITEKGRTAAEMLVFARYVMFSEVYWHHTVRSATAMLQRAVFRLQGVLDFGPLLHLTEAPFIEHLMACKVGPTRLLGGLFGPRRQLFKRCGEYSLLEQPELYRQLARRPYPQLVALSALLSEELGRLHGRAFDVDDVLIDAPPVKREIEINMQVRYSKEDRYHPLAQVSPVVRTLAERQFDDYVKRVRVFVRSKFTASLDPTVVATALGNVLAREGGQ